MNVIVTREASAEEGVAPCLCGRPALLFRFYDNPAEPGAHINIDCSGGDACPLELSLTKDVGSQTDVDAFLAAWNNRGDYPK